MNQMMMIFIQKTTAKNIKDQNKKRNQNQKKKLELKKKILHQLDLMLKQLRRNLNFGASKEINKEILYILYILMIH